MEDSIGEIIIRNIRGEELPCLEDMLYNAIFQPDSFIPISREIINNPEIRLYIENFGQKEDDHCLVAIFDKEIIGAVWVRILSGDIRGYGNIDKHTPEFAISLHEKFRNRGYGTLLMKKMIALLKDKDYKQASLSVNKDNYAVNMYKKLGFEIIQENKEDFIMLLKLD